MAKKGKNRLLDLDALNPSIGDVKFGGKKYKMVQPGYEDFITLPILFDKMMNFGAELEGLEKQDEVAQAMGDLREDLTKINQIVCRVIPDLENPSAFTIPQLLNLMEFISAKFGEQVDEEGEGTGSGKGK